MAQGHMDRLSALDVSFLTNESSSSHMHVGAVAIFEGPPPSYDDLLDHISSRLHLVPRFRQKLAFPPAPTGRPFWVDDPAFNLDYHVRHSALPSPGSEEQLRNMAARDLLPAARPHEAAVGAVAGPGTDPQALRVRHQDPPRARRRRLRGRHRHRPVRPQAGSRAGRARPRVGAQPRALGRDAAGQGRRGRPLRARCASPGASSTRSSTPTSTLQQATRVAEGARRGRLELRQPRPGDAAQRRDRLAPPLRLGARRPRRSSSGSRTRLGGTVNDVVLAVVAGALRDWLQGRGDAHRGDGAARPGAGLDPRRRRAGPARQQDRRDAGADPGLRRGPGQAAGGRRATAWRGSSSPSRRSAPR